MDSQISSVNEFLEEYKDFSLNEIHPCLDVLFNAYSYEKEQLQVIGNISVEEYNTLLKSYKLGRTMALKLNGDLSCAACKNPLISSDSNNNKEEITIFGCGHAAHRSCLDVERCPVEGCWNNDEGSDSLLRRRSTVSHIRSSESIEEKKSTSVIEDRSIEDLVNSLNSGEFSGASVSLSVVAPHPSAIFRRKWLLKAASMSSCLEMDINI